MAIAQVLASAITGLSVNALKANVVAANIVNQNTDGYKAKSVRTLSQVTARPSNGGGAVARIIAEGEVDLALEFTRLIEVEAAYRANAGVIRVAEEIERESVNVIA